MEVAAYVLLGVSALLGIVVGSIYGNHRIPAIWLFGVAVFFFDISVCLFWALKTAPSAESMAGTLVAQEPTPKYIPKILFSNKVPTPASLEIGDSGAIFEYVGKNGEPLIQIGDDPITIELLQDGNAAVSTVVRNQQGQIVAEIVKNDWKLKPSLLWDRNFSERAVEVRDDHGDIILQAEALPDRIRLQGAWFTKGGAFYQLVSLGPGNGSAMVMGLQHKRTITPLFLYPSNQNLGKMTR